MAWGGPPVPEWDRGRCRFKEGNRAMWGKLLAAASAAVATLAGAVGGQAPPTTGHAPSAVAPGAKPVRIQPPLPEALAPSPADVVAFEVIPATPFEPRREPYAVRPETLGPEAYRPAGTREAPIRRQVGEKDVVPLIGKKKRF